MPSHQPALFDEWWLKRLHLADNRAWLDDVVRFGAHQDARRALQIAVNMERWRWLPYAFEANAILVNVPDAHLMLNLGGQKILESRVVVGRPKDPTPILRAEGAGVTVNPAWTVPATIARKEILPKLKASRFYLQSQDMILLNGPPNDPYGLQVNWRAIPRGTFPFRIQQRPGSKNALGTIKIELPNRFNVYLHDTPAKSAFARTRRDVSHGCIRVEQILPLASYALRDSPDALQKIDEIVSAGKTKFLAFRQHLPVYLLYWTVFAGNDDLHFRPDIYGRDQRLIDAMRRGAPVHMSANMPKCLRG